MGLPRTYKVCLLIVNHSFRRDRSGGALRSLLATGKYPAPARSQKIFLRPRAGAW